jgi:hypothetical protein
MISTAIWALFAYTSISFLSGSQLNPDFVRANFPFSVGIPAALICGNAYGLYKRHNLDVLGAGMVLLLNLSAVFVFLVLLGSGGI